MVVVLWSEQIAEARDPGFDFLVAVLQGIDVNVCVYVYRKLQSCS